METFTVTTSLEHYAETNSSAGSKMPMDILDMPYSLRIVNTAFLEDIRSTRIEEAFGYVTGLNTQGSNANAFTLRGFSAAGSNLQSVQVDGLPGPPSRFASPPTVNVERVEVIKGPTSVLYGQANPGGLLNIVTKIPQERRRTTLSTFVTAFAGKDGSAFGDELGYTVSFDSTGAVDREKRLLYRLVVSYENLDSFRDFSFQENIYVHPSLTYRFNDHTSITIKADYVREDRQSNDGLAVPFRDASLLPPINVTLQPPNTRDEDNGDSATATFQTRLSDNWFAQASYRYTWHTDSRLSLETAQGLIVNNTTDFRLSTIRPRFRVQENEKGYNFLDANVRGSLGSEKMKHTLLLGVNGGREWLRTNRLAFGPFVTPVNIFRSVPNVDAVFPTNPTGLQDRRTEFWNYGVYASDQIKFGARVDALLGVRWDQQKSRRREITPTIDRTLRPNDQDVLPSAGLVFHVFPQLSLYGSYSEGFKPQAPGSVDANDNPSFPAETSEQREVGVKFQGLDNKLSASIGVYEIKKGNVLNNTGQFTPSGNGIATLSGLQKSQGVELEGAFLPVPNWQIQFGYTYIDAKVKSSPTASIVGALLDNTPRSSANFWTRYNVPGGRFEGLGFGLGFIYAGKRQGIITNVDANRFELPDYARVDTAIYYRRGRFDYALNIGNLFDNTYIAGVLPGDTTRITPGDPRKVTLSVKLMF